MTWPGSVGVRGPGSLNLSQMTPSPSRTPSQARREARIGSLRLARTRAPSSDFGARWLPPPTGAGSQFLKNKQSTHTATGMITDSDDDPSRPRSDSKSPKAPAAAARQTDSGTSDSDSESNLNRVCNMNSESRNRKLKQERIVTSGRQFEETKTKIMIH